MNFNTSTNKRANNRFKIAVNVKLSYGDNEVQTLKTRDIGDNGIFLEKKEQPLPCVGTPVTLQVFDTLADGNAPIVKGEVVRLTEEGIGIRFLA